MPFQFLFAHSGSSFYPNYFLVMRTLIYGCKFCFCCHCIEPQARLWKYKCKWSNWWCMLLNDAFSDTSSSEKIFCYMIILKIIWKENYVRGIKVCKSEDVVCLKDVQVVIIFLAFFTFTVFRHLGVVLWWVAMFSVIFF